MNLDYLGELLNIEEIVIALLPDLTLFINGLTLVVVEVKKKMTFIGIESEKDRLLDWHWIKSNIKNSLNYKIPQWIVKWIL
ncbi:hypothetical protein HYE35_02960 [Mycoplasmopsis bovis]|nr:hypothetical protein [Mycoplasmopsis bovis]QQH21704.1 hypothetical protein HYE35_02960 [Mycoplasmopsis bovis]